jgi:hypothetical protein
MSVKEFIEDNSEKLIQKLKEYSESNISHCDMQKYIDSIFDLWYGLDCDKTIEKSKEEEIFWHAVWTMQHVADEEHFKDGITQKEIVKCLNFLNNNYLPKGYIANRP